MAPNVLITRNENESPTSVLRRFRSRVKSAGLLMRSRMLRYRERPLSPLKTKQRKLRKLERQKKYERLYKLGKIS